MDENKKTNSGTESAGEDNTTIEAVDPATLEQEETTAPAAETAPDKKEKKQRKKKDKPERPKKLKNQALFRRGGYSLAITAIALAVLILFNWLVAALSDRFNLQFDMSSEKVNTISAENLDYIKGVDKDVTITVCATEEDYASYLSSYASQLYSVASGGNGSDYYSQTVNLVKRYGDYNKKIDVRFINPQSTEFTEISTKYSSDNLAYGDIIVASAAIGEDGTENERHKKISFTDIYSLTDESGYAAYGGGYTLSGNNIETALTSAVAYVTSSESKKAALLTGHSGQDYSATFLSLLKDNNYEVETISDSLVTAIPDTYDAVILIAPSTDFVGSELDAIAAFLDNDGELGKGLLYFADATAPALPNLYDFLSQWGIQIDSGILFETTANQHIDGDPTTMGIYPAEDSITDGLQYCICGYNVPITETNPTESSVTVTPLMTTSDTVVAAPIGSGADWSDYSEADKGQYLGVVQAAKEDYDDDNNKITSYVMAFSGIEYIYSDWTEYAQLSNKNIALACADRAVNVGDSGISFVSKTITNESYSDAVNASGAMAIRIIFMILLPILVIAAGVYIYIRRKNAE